MPLLVQVPVRLDEFHRITIVVQVTSDFPPNSMILVSPHPLSGHSHHRNAVRHGSGFEGLLVLLKGLHCRFVRNIANEAKFDLADSDCLTHVQFDRPI